MSNHTKEIKNGIHFFPAGILARKQSVVENLANLLVMPLKKVDLISAFLRPISLPVAVFESI